MFRLGRKSHCVAAAALALTVRASAGFTATLNNAHAQFVADQDGGAVALTIDPASHRLRHNRFFAGDPGFASDFDFDSTRLGVQSLKAGPAASIEITAGAAPVTLLADDSSAALGAVYSLIDHAVTGGFGGVEISYDSIAALTLRCGGADDIVSVMSTAGIAESALVDAGDGSDMIVLGDAANSLDFLTIPIDLRGGSGRDGLLVLDQGAPYDPAEYHLTAERLSRQVGGAAAVVGLGAGDVEDLLLFSSAGAATINVESLPLGTASGSVLIAGGAGDDEIRIGDAAGTVRGVIAPLIVDAGGGSNHLVILNTGEVQAGTLTISSTRCGVGVDDDFFPLGGYVEYSNISLLEFRLGPGKDDVHVSPSAVAAIRIADAGSAPGPLFPGDRIEVLTQGTNGVTIASPEPAHLRYTFADRRDVDFIGFERMRPGGAIRGVAFQDLNGDGIRQADEPPQALAAVALSIDGFPATAWGRVTNADGTFEFTDLIPADYLVTVLPAGDLVPSAGPIPVALALEQSVDSVELGLSVIPGGTISGVVFADADFSGTFDAVESGLSDAVVFADLNGDEVLNADEPRAVTSAAGSFTLDFAEDSTGTLLAIGPGGYVATTPGPAFSVSHGESITGLQIGLALYPANDNTNAPGGSSGASADGNANSSGSDAGDDAATDAGSAADANSSTPGDSSGGGSPRGDADAAAGSASGSADATPGDSGDSAFDAPDSIARRCAGCGQLGLLGWVALLMPLGLLRRTMTHSAPLRRRRR